MNVEDIRKFVADWRKANGKLPYYKATAPRDRFIIEALEFLLKEVDAKR